MSNADLVAEFHHALGDSIPSEPQVPTREVLELRATLIAEEFDEVVEEFARLRVRLDQETETSALDLADVAHELADLLYVTYGTFVALGVPADEVFAEVHRANALKATGPRRADGKQLKPVGWAPADILSVILRSGSNH